MRIVCWNVNGVRAAFRRGLGARLATEPTPGGACVPVRARNVGWRLDYIFAHHTVLPRVRDAGICADVTGADHCPVWLDLAD